MTTKDFLTKENLVNMFSTATYGNEHLGVRCCIRNGFVAGTGKRCEEFTFAYTSKGETPCREDIWADVILAGGKLTITDYASDDDEPKEVHVDKDALGRAFNKWRDKCPRDYADFCTGEDDLYTCWNYMQVVMYGEVIYG